MADTAYDADPLRQAIAAKGRSPSSPTNPSRALQISARRTSLRPAPPGGVLFLKTQKQFRRVATRFEKTARNYRAVVTLAAIILWMR